MTSPLGIIGGGAFLEAGPLVGAAPHKVVTGRGVVRLHMGDGFVFLRRHGENEYHPPHAIPHHAHVLALESLGVQQVAGFASSGALQPDIRPGDLVVPDDYISWHDPPTFAENEYLHIVPSLDAGVRDLLMRAAERAIGRGERGIPPGASSGGAASGGGTDPAASLHRRGVYVETRGPRFETAAEVRVLAAHGSVVGMTAASEATLCQERGIGYAMICTVDNWANGVGAEPLTLEGFQAQLARSGVVAQTILGHLLRLRREAAGG